MRKSLLIISTVMLGGSAAIAAPVQKIIPDTYAAGLSPNGKWGVSSVYELMTVTDFTSGQSYDFPGEATPGLGNCITDDGVLVGSARDNAIIFIDGEFRSFDEALSLKYTMSLLNAITPDAKYAVGILSNTEPNSLTYVPALWELNADGTPKSMELLPCPVIDFTGRVGQSSTANYISADGTVVMGQFVDYSGSAPQPVVYVKGDDGKWSYSLPAENLINPSHYEFPEYPEDSPEAPDVTDYMTDEAKAQYDAAMDNWRATGYQPDLYPNAADYMTPEQVAAYNKDSEEYNKLAAEYNEKLMAFFDILEKAFAESTLFEYNSFSLSPDGKLLTGNQVEIENNPDSWYPTSTYFTWIFDLASGDAPVKLSDSPGISAVQVLNGGTVMGVNGNSMSANPPQSFIKLPENAGYIALEEYLKAADPEAYTWMQENLFKEITVYNTETYEPEAIDFMLSGLAYVSDDLKTIYSGIGTYAWGTDDPSGSGYSSYYLSQGTAGIGSAVAGNGSITVKALRGGELRIVGEATSVEVYDLTGRKVFAAPAESSISTGLAGGAYIVKVAGPGASRTIKVNF